jgi:hypothetical protein
MMLAMKKTIIFTILTLAIGFTAYSQGMEKQSVTSGHGMSVSNAGETVQFTIGQAYVTNTLTSDRVNFLTSGFEQPTYRGLAALLDPSLELVKMEIYPNPAVDHITLAITLLDDNGAQGSIINMWGQVLKVEKFNSPQGDQKLAFNFGTLAIGVYTVKVVANGRVYAKKLLINEAGGPSIFE